MIWLTTVGRDLTPQPNPVWFLWDGADGVLVYNRADAKRLDHVRERPRVSFNFDGDGAGGDIIVLTGEAEPVAGNPPVIHYPDYLEKYREGIARISGSVDVFAKAYPVPLRIRLTRVRGY
ncbi:TIGR03667 family PPOX class F420-dependent oxidoreductase [Streptosporangium sp. KLBMP 9127]|nr:TIGR03667 family PPOX class F420-dependent oxidoreductase [Streptosporangium sp. KLBMP 9127]